MFVFFFQAEDGIRDIGVTGVQTCALPIWVWTPRRSRTSARPASATARRPPAAGIPAAGATRAAGGAREARRNGRGAGGEGGRFPGAAESLKKKNKSSCSTEPILSDWTTPL